MIVIIGPTAAGKSAKAMELAPTRNGEIISADSRHVYRGMDIGTNKPTPGEQRLVSHHLIDIRDPHEAFSLAEYVALARDAIRDVASRGKTPMLVGGTGQYVRALLEGWQVPQVAPNENLRERWLEFAKLRGEDALFAELIQRDPDAARMIDKRNFRRVVRALEVMEVTGERWSALQRREPPRDEIEMVYLNLPREVLYAKVDARLSDMVKQGWLNEVEQLLGRLHARGIDAETALKLPSMSSLGYREMIQVARGEMSLDEAIERIKRETRRFIRMQDTWFRKLAERFGSKPTMLSS
jgi:tRNA dimethylallyltransferase